MGSGLSEGTGFSRGSNLHDIVTAARLMIVLERERAVC